MSVKLARFLMYPTLLCLSFLFIVPAAAAPIMYKGGGSSNTSTTADSQFRSSQALINQLSIGATHEKQDADSWNNSEAISLAKQEMQASLTYQNQQIMGWGASDPEPKPGVYNWSSLDQRVALMRSTKAQMVLTICCAPGWMRPAGYSADWTYLEVAPDPSYVQDYANLAKLVALRYPDVKYFQVWNELKGMWSTSPGATPGVSHLNRWDYERYTTLYNAVYDAIKRVRPDALIGGPYVVMDSDGNRADMSNPGPSYSWGTLDQRPLDVITYWLAHKHGADFLAVDGTSANKDGVWKVDEFASAQKFVDVYNWLRMQPKGGATLPVWWAEWYAGNPSTAPKSLTYSNALMASDEIYTAMSGAAVLLTWQPQGDAQGYSYPEGIWTDTRVVGGGQPTAYYYTAMAFKKYFGPGTYIYQPTVSTSTVTAITSGREMMVVNHLTTSQTVIVNGVTIQLGPYQVLLRQFLRVPVKMIWHPLS